MCLLTSHPAKEVSPRRKYKLGIRQSGGTASLAPGATLTPILEDVPDDILDGIRQAIPRGKLAEVDDIVGTFIFLASDDAAHFRGQCLSPNGGDVSL